MTSLQEKFSLLDRAMPAGILSSRRIYEGTNNNRKSLLEPAKYLEVQRSGDYVGRLVH